MHACLSKYAVYLYDGSVTGTLDMISEAAPSVDGGGMMTGCARVQNAAKNGTGHFHKPQPSLTADGRACGSIWSKNCLHRLLEEEHVL